MKRIALVLVLVAACRKASPEQPAPEAARKLAEPPAAPVLQLAPSKEGFSVVAARPKGVLTGAQHPTLTFSEPVVALSTLEQQDPASAFQLSPAVKGRWHWLGSSSVEFVNDEPFPYSTAFHVTAPKGLKSLSGKALAEEVKLDFTTPPVEVQRYDVDPPEYLCKWSVPEQHFTVVVNQPLQSPEKAFVFDAAGQRTAAVLVKSISLLEERAAAQKQPRLARAETGFADQRVRYELTPAKPLPKDSAFSIALDLAATHAAQGTQPAVMEWKQECHTMGPMKVTGIARCFGEQEHCSHGPITLQFTNPLGDVAELKKRLKLTPDPQLEWDDAAGADLGAELQQNRTRVILFGKFKPSTTYQVHVDAGVKDKLGQEAPAADATVQLDDLLPSLYVSGEQALLEAAGDGQLPVQVTNLELLEADLWRLTPADLAKRELCERGNCERFPATAPSAPLRLQLSYPKNEARLHGVDLRAALNSDKTGLVLARLRAPGTEFADSPLRVLAQLTDLAVHAKLGADASLVWVTSVQGGKPVQGAKVQAFDQTGAVVAEAQTGADGVAQLPGYDAFLKSRQAGSPPRALLAATFAADVGYALVRDYDGGLATDVQRDYGTEPRGMGVVFADRGIYRPGDVVHLKGIARTQVKGALTTPAGKSVTVSVHTPDGDEAMKQQVTLSKYGTFTLDFTAPRDGKLGAWNVDCSAPQLSLGSGSFVVAEYRAPQFRVDVQGPQKDLFAGDELTATVIARYLFGGAMERAQAEWSVGRQSEGFSPPGNESFQFGRNTWGWDDRAPAGDSGLFASGHGEIGKDGSLGLKPGKLEAPGDRTSRYTLEADVADVSRQHVAARASVLVHPAAHYVGLGSSAQFAQVGAELAVPVIAAQPDGAHVSAAVHVTALLRVWHSIQKRTFTGNYETLSEAVDEKTAECDVQTSKDPAACKLTLPKPGFYTLRAESKDAQGRLALTTVSVYAVGAGFAAWQQQDGNKVEVVADKASYQPGETAHLLVKSPWPKCKALLSVEREGVHDSRLLELNGTAATLDVAITEEMVPNAFVGVLLVRERVEQGGTEPGGDPGRPAMRIGYAELSVGKGIKKLDVSVSTPRTEYKPREKVAVDVTVRDSRAQPATSEVQVFAVDEAVLRLTAYQLPDLLEAMFPRHVLQVATADSLITLVRKQRFGEKGELIPGGGGGLGPSSDVRSKFATTVLWQTAETGADGKAHVEFELPDNLTTFRIMAVAATSSDRFGAGQAEIRVALPLLVLPSLPRFARVGDEFEAGVALHSVSGGSVTVTAQVAGGVQLAEAVEKRVDVEAGVGKEVRFKLKAVSPGKATLRFKASLGALSDGVEQSIPISLPVELEAVAVAGDTTDARQEGLVPPRDVRDDVGGLTLQLSSSALGGLGEGMRQLVDYPYGCLEQLSSRLVPFVAIREVEKVFGVTAGPNEDKKAQAERMNGLLAQLTGAQGPQSVDADQVVADTVQKIEKLQTPSGGFLYWPTAECAYAWPSIYATLALHRAREFGYAVKPETLSRARKFLAQKAAGEAGCRYEHVGPETRIFALQVLARMGDPKPSYYDELYAEKDKLPLFAKALLADAMVVGKGKRPRAEALLQDLFDAARETPRDVHFEESDSGSYAPLMSSDTRTTGMVLQTLVDLKPQHPFVGKIARYLTDVRKNGGAYRNTQEAAYALMGLAEVVRVRERQAPDFAAHVLLGGKELLTAQFRERSLSVKDVTLPMKELQRGASSLPLEFKLDGQGSLFYTALLRYAPATLPKEPRNEGLFVQRWFEPFSESGKQATQFGAGELVRVRVRIATSQERNFVAVEVPLPAGLEAVDSGLAVSRALPQTRGEERPEGEESAALDEQPADDYGFWSPFNYSEKRDDRVVYFSDHLPPGVHVQSFVARATTPGRFVLKAAHAGEMYSPEVFGRSESGELTVVATQPLAQK